MLELGFLTRKARAENFGHKLRESCRDLSEFTPSKFLAPHVHLSPTFIIPLINPYY